MPDVPEAPGSRPGLVAALADRYTIERELGRGGMAVVYLAHDLTHDRQVAIKAFAWREKAYQKHEWALANVRVLPYFDPLRSDPRFTQLLKKMRL